MTENKGVVYRACNFCGGRKFTVFKKMEASFPEQIYGDVPLSMPDVGQNLKLQYLQCLQCGLIAINPVTHLTDLNKNSFDGEKNIVAWADMPFEDYEKDKANEISIVYEQYQFESYRQFNRILDVSCGPGVSLNWLKNKKSWDVYGIDPDRYSVRMAKEKYGLEIQNGLIDDLAHADGFFDLVIMDNSLEHYINPAAALIKAYKLLRPGGGLFIFVPNAEGLSTHYMDANAYWGHWFFYTPKTLHAYMSKIGFMVMRLIAIQNPVNPALLDKIDLNKCQEGLIINLQGVEEVQSEVGRLKFYADYFNLIAVKPEISLRTNSELEGLLKTAQLSMNELNASDIDIK